jgi:tripartite-type tricarboxylate transporter receptor subunit TctC
MRMRRRFRPAPARGGSDKNYREARMKNALRVLIALLTAATAAFATAEGYPERPIRLIVPYPPGSSTNDILGRALASRLTPLLGQQVVVDNRSGASGNVGSELVAKSTPDGYTLLIGVAGPLAVGPAVYKNLGYVPTRDLAPIAMYAAIPYILVVNPSVPANNIKELIALAKSKPGQLNFASSGSGGSPHLCGELFKSMAGIDIVHVPYKGAGIAMIDVLSGQIPMICTGATALSAHIKSGRLRPLGIASLKRSSQFPDLPTIAEQGLPGFDVTSWTGLLAPAKTPEPVIRKLYEAVAKIMATDDMKHFLASVGAEPALMNPHDFGAYLKVDTERWAKVVKAANLKID